MTEDFSFDDMRHEKPIHHPVIRDAVKYTWYVNIIESPNPNHTSLWYALANTGLGILVQPEIDPIADTPLEVTQFYIPEPVKPSDITAEDIVAFRKHLFEKYPAAFGVGYSIDLPQQDLNALVAEEAAAQGLISPKEEA